MPSMLKQRIRTIKLLASLKLICAVITIITLALGVEAIIDGNNTQLGIVLLAFSAFCVSVISLLSIPVNKSRTQEAVYVIPLKHMSFQSIVDAFGAQKIADDGYALLLTFEGIHCRLLIQHTSRFDSHLLTRQRKQINRAVNLKYQVKSAVTMYEALSRLRINVIVCEKSSEEVYNHIGKNIDQLLSRNESIVPIAVVLDEQVMLFPNCMSIPHLSQIRRYEVAARYVCNAIVRQNVDNRTGDGDASRIDPNS